MKHTSCFSVVLIGEQRKRGGLTCFHGTSGCWRGDHMADGNWWNGARRWIHSGGARREIRLGLALGGGFARGIAHVGVLRVFERARIPVHYISGVSAGSIVASAFASGSSSDEIEA